MKKLFAAFLSLLAISAYSADNFNTLDTNGTVTVNAGTNLNTSALVLDASITGVTGSKAAGTAAVSALLGGGVYNSTLPAPTTGQQTALQVDATGRLRVNASEVASGATDSGNPIKIGGVYNSTQPTFTNGQRGDLQVGSRGSLNTQIMGSDGSVGASVAGANADALSGSATGAIAARSLAYAYNGTSWDRLRGGITTPTATLTGHQNSLPWAIYNATPTVRTEAQGGPLQSDASGNLLVNTAASATGAYSFSNLKANATTTVKSGAGTLHTISVNTKGITNTVTVYDNTAGSGTTIATIDTTIGQDTLIFDLAFATGLTVVIAGGTAADITITYK